MKQLRSLYLRELEAWNRVHRVIGAKGVQASTLVAESEEALDSIREMVLLVSGFVDVGAGAGILGAPLLWMFPSASRRIVLIEPDAKKAAFLLHFRNLLPDSHKRQLIVIFDKVEMVSHEIVGKVANPGDRIFGARAFSGEYSLEKSFSLSDFKEEPLYTFLPAEEGISTKAMLKKVCI